ncbi:hypothetical protein [Mycolicibacterium sp. A43C]
MTEESIGTATVTITPEFTATVEDLIREIVRQELASLGQLFADILIGADD